MRIFNKIMGIVYKGIGGAFFLAGFWGLALGRPIGLSLICFPIAILNTNHGSNLEEVKK